jgi:hypothetical protein
MMRYSYCRLAGVLFLASALLGQSKAQNPDQPTNGSETFETRPFHIPRTLTNVYLSDRRARGLYGKNGVAQGSVGQTELLPAIVWGLIRDTHPQKLLQ